nr:proton-conducting transporter membrane subunit [Flexivirga oryzae]
MLAGVIGSALTDDLVNLFVWFEVAGLASFGLTGFFLEQPTALEAAFKATVLTSIGGFVIFAGSAMLYALTGALNFGQLQHALPGAASRGTSVAVALVVCGYAIKAGLVPFHAWLPDAHAAGPGAVSAMFSAVLVDLGVVGLVRMLICTRTVLPRLDDLLLGLGITSAVVGALLALAQDDLKRLLAWDTVSQAGIIVVGFASNDAEGISGAVYHLANHGLFKALLFLSAGAVLHATGLGKLSELGGLWRRRRVLTAGFTVGALAISGVPPLNGYASLGLIHQGVADDPVVHVLALTAQVLTVAALARATYLGFYRPRAQEYEHLETQHIGMRIGLGSLAIGCAAFGVLPTLIVPRIAAPAASFVLHTSAHAAGATAGVSTVPALSIPAGLSGGTDLVTSLGEIIAGILLAAAYIRWGEPRPVGWLRRLHTGSVNDYATFAVAGILLVSVTLLA